MSSMRNAVSRRQHKERAQPLERARLGLLEKAKDYKLRAKDHRVKKQKLKILKEKASQRNPDEFSFAMLNSQVDRHGRKIAHRGNKPLSQDVVRLLKSQDAGYLRTILQQTRKERQELEQRVVIEDQEVKALKDADEGRRGEKTVYVDDKEEQRRFKPDKPSKKVQKEVAEDEDVDMEDVRPKKLSKKQEEAKLQAEKEERAVLRRRERQQERVQVHLEAVKAREKDLVLAEEELEKQRARMNNTIGGINKHGVKFKIRERKK